MAATDQIPHTDNIEESKEVTDEQNKKRTIRKIKKELTETDKLIEDLTKELIEETKKSFEKDPKKQAFKDIFKIDEEELMDLLENDHHMHNNEDESMDEEVKDDQI